MDPEYLVRHKRMRWNKIDLNLQSKAADAILPNFNKSKPLRQQYTTTQALSRNNNKGKPINQ